jgi:ribosomal protein S27AE
VIVHSQKIIDDLENGNTEALIVSEIAKCKTRLKKTQNPVIARELCELETRLENVRSGNELTEYFLKSAMLVSRFIDLDAQESQVLSARCPDQSALAEIASQKADITNEYYSIFDPAQVQYSSLVLEYSCTNCGIFLDSLDNSLACIECGYTVNCVETAVDLSYREIQEYDYKTQFSYKRIGHFNDWVARFMSKEKKTIPEAVLDCVRKEAVKEGIKPNELGEDRVRRYLKKHDFNEYFDNVINIINRVNGREPFKLSRELDDKLVEMFNQIQAPFEQFKPEGRKNFLSYSYTLHKFFQILGLPEYSQYFPLLKSMDKLRVQDTIFKQIVDYMAERDNTVDWVFRPSC